MKSTDIQQLIDDGGNATTVHFGHIERWIQTQFEEAQLQLVPDFQRGHVWRTEQQISFIEYILRGERWSSNSF